MSQVEINYIGEGRSDDAIARRLIAAANGIPGISYRTPLVGTGKDSLDKRLAGLNAGVKHGGNPVLVLRDIDNDAPCPSVLVASLLPYREPQFMLRICVKESETWLMADSNAYAKYCGVSAGQLPRNLESITDPKSLILGWAESGIAPKLRRHVDEARKRGVPDWALLGEWHANFADEHWDPIEAASSGKSNSLQRALARLKSVIAGTR